MVIFMILTINYTSFAVTATVNVTAVRIRESASTEANIVTNIYQEDEVEILEENGEWYKVKYGEKIGYAKAEFFTKKAEEPQNPTANEKEPQEPQNTTENEGATEQNLVPNDENEQTAQMQRKVGETFALSNSIKVRVIPNLSTIAKTEIAQGTNVTIETKLGNWYKVTNQTISGWITESKLLEKSTPNEPPVATQSQPEPQLPEMPQNTTEPQESKPEPTEEKPQETKQPEEKSTTNKTAIVIVETARVRKTASTNSDIVEVLDEDDIVTITGEEGNFYKITSDKIGSGYISKSLVRQKDVSSRSTAEERENIVNHEAKEEESQSLSQKTNSSVTGNDVVEFAKQFLGYPYVLGASSPEKGFDCSGFTRYVYGHFGFSLGQVAANQTSLGTVVERENLQIGDLILFYNDGKTKIGHCGIFIGGGDFIHSANPQRGVVIDNLNSNSYYSQRFVTARRIVE